MERVEHQSAKVRNRVSLAAGDTAGLERVAACMVRCPFSLDRMVSVSDNGKVVHRAETADCQPFPILGDGKLIRGLASNPPTGLGILSLSKGFEIDDESRWGITISNGSKNVTFDGCAVNRFDAHQGIANATIRNSTIGHAGIQLMGVGTLLLENTTVRKGYLVSLREDYGSSWRGDMIIRNCVLQPTRIGKGLALLVGKNNGQHDYGHPCQMPETITIEGLKIADKEHPDDYQGPVVLGNLNPAFKQSSYVEKVPYARPRRITVKGVTVASGKPLGVSQNPVMFRNVKVEGIPNP